MTANPPSKEQSDEHDGGKGGVEYIAPQLRSLALPIESVHPDPANARKHGEKNMAAIVASLSRFGQRAPIVVQRKGMVVRAGNGRLAAAKSLGWSHIAAVVVDDESIDAVAFAIADNRTAELAEWDSETLASLLNTLPEDDLKSTGFDESDLKELLSELTPQGEQDAEPQVDRAEELRVKWGVERGQVWTLGEHRLMCGDSTIAEDVGRLMAGEKADLCFTDPPYGADIQYATHDDTQDGLKWLIAGFFPLAEANSDVIALTPGINNLWHYKRPDWVLCWFYGAGTGRSPWGFTAWQPIMVWGKCPKLAHGEGCHPDGFQFMMSHDDAAKNRDLDHACPKPLSVWVRFMERLLHKGATTVYEPFSGAGTTIIACEQLKRKCRAMEISPGYVAVALQRWADATGGKPTRV